MSDVCSDPVTLREQVLQRRVAALEGANAKIAQYSLTLRALLRKAVGHLNDQARAGGKSADIRDEIAKALDE